MKTENVGNTQEARSPHSLVLELGETFTRNADAAWSEYDKTASPLECRGFRECARTWDAAERELREIIEKLPNDCGK